MTWTDDLREAVSEPLPMRGDREERLLTTLLDDLAQGPFDGPDEEAGDDTATPGPDVFVTLERRIKPQRRRLLAVWQGAAAAVVLVIGLVVVANFTSDVGPTSDVDRATETILLACASFAESSPSVASINAELQLDPPVVTGLVDYREGFDAVEARVIGLAATELPVATRDELSLIGGLLVQAELAAAQSGPAPAETLAMALDRLDLLVERDERFSECRR